MIFFNSYNISSGIAYEEAIFSFISSSLFLFVILLVLFMSTCIILISFDKDYSILLRFKNKFDYLKNLFLSITIGNFLIYTFTIVISILLLTIKYFGRIYFSDIAYYHIPFVLYNFFTIIKYFVIVDILALIGVCIYKNLGRVFSYTYYILILILYYVYPVSMEIIGSFSIKNLFFKYHLYPYQYATFYLELSSLIITICTLILLTIFILCITVRFNKIKIDE